MLCDAHIHFIPEELAIHTAFYKGAWTDRDKLYKFIDGHRISRAFLVYPTTDAHLKLGGDSRVCALYNTIIAKMLKEHSAIVAAGLVDFKDSLVDAQVKDLKQQGFCAVSLASSYEGKFMTTELIPLFESVQKHGFAVFVHPQTTNPIGFERVKDPLLMPVVEYSFDIAMFLGLLMMEQIFDKFKIKFIFSSLGGVIPFLKDRFDRVYSMLLKRQMVKDLGRLPSDILRSVYVDTSGASLENIEMALDLFGEDKILWGSDYPVNIDVEENLKVLDSLGEKIKRKITHGNFDNLFDKGELK